jgi:hypothetical protein
MRRNRRIRSISATIAMRPSRVDAAGLVDLGATFCLGEGLCNACGAHRTSPVSAREEEQRAWPYTTPVVAEFFEEMR